MCLLVAGCAGEPNTGDASSSSSGATTFGGSTSEVVTSGETTADDGTTTTTGVVTSGVTTTGPMTTGDVTTEIPETGIVEGIPTVMEDACAEDDGPAIAFKFDVAGKVCDADFPEDAPIVKIVLNRAAPLEPGYYKLEVSGGFASFDDGNGEKISKTGTISILDWNGGFPYGGISIEFDDRTVISDTFEAIYCPTMPPCK